MTRKFNKATGYRVNIENSIIFLHTRNKLLGTKILKTAPFIITQNKYLGINITKYVYNLYVKTIERW